MKQISNLLINNSRYRIIRKFLFKKNSKQDINKLKKKEFYDFLKFMDKKSEKFKNFSLAEIE